MRPNDYLTIPSPVRSLWIAPIRLNWKTDFLSYLRPLSRLIYKLSSRHLIILGLLHLTFSIQTKPLFVP